MLLINSGKISKMRNFCFNQT